MTKLEELKSEIRSLVKDGACIAFSGGVDSSLILKLAADAGRELGRDVHAVTFETRLHPVSDVQVSKSVAKEMGAIHTIIRVDEFENRDLLKNPVNRCYICKNMLFSNLLDLAKENGLKYVIDGTNADDHKVYRPGIRALKELGVISPLAGLGITKAEVRAFASSLGISVASRPSAPCMATRLPYDTEISFELLERIEKGEEFIKGLGFSIVRLRIHKDIARIEVPADDFMKLIGYRDQVTASLKSLGFTYITLDMEGFRSGSMDIGLDKSMA
ncbi:ATP-dependent sacrificial sulfur transferase LarE [Youngiibacter fragilis]|uniref:Asparagine synthase n=1 Tax=Youngiibacter fragilis 232.1 TaxID=994573 RepID=V7I6K8_9CLOT|nr:ATP-dependent sacrificial sulfur transferase LarE [Youngiibacter fragilis]ETA80931.1 asparagine synthase [Youngiibacter fragilis 232.1]